MNGIAIQQQFFDKSSRKNDWHLCFARTESLQDILVLRKHLHFNLYQTLSASVLAATRSHREDFHFIQHKIVMRQVLALKRSIINNLAANLPPVVNMPAKSTKEVMTNEVEIMLLYQI